MDQVEEVFELYQVLHDEEIRILTLLPATAHQPIRTSLSVVRLSDAGLCMAISYCWGDPNDRADILCNGVPISITKSLCSALMAMRSAIEPVRLWADAVCINQHDISEKNIQVPLMTQIYRGASRVLIWLGPMDREMCRVFGYAHEVEPEPCIQEVGHCFLNPLKMSLRRALGCVLERPWFRRIWVVQELAVSGDRAHILYAPGKIVSWSNFLVMAHNIDGRATLEQDRYAALLERIRQRYAASATDIPLLPLLHHFREWEATDPSCNRSSHQGFIHS